MHSPKIEQIEVAARGDVRRAKLYYLRDRVGKRARVRERRYTGPEEIVEPGLLHDPADALEADAGRRARRSTPRAPTAEAVVDASGAGRRRGRGAPRPPEATAERRGAGGRGRSAEPAARGRGRAPTPTREPTSRRRRRRRRGVRRREGASRRAARSLELVVIVAVALGLALGIQAFLVKPYRIPSESMVPTLQVGQRVLVNRIGKRFGDPHVGDIVVFHPPEGAETATAPCGGAPAARGRGLRPADARTAPTSTSSSASSPARATRSAIRDGHVIRNGKRQKEPFITTRARRRRRAATSRRRSRFPPGTGS